MARASGSDPYDVKLNQLASSLNAKSYLVSYGGSVVIHLWMSCMSDFKRGAFQSV